MTTSGSNSTPLRVAIEPVRSVTKETEMRKKVALGIIVLFLMIGVYAQDGRDLLRLGYTENDIAELNSIQLLNPRIWRYTAPNPAYPWESKQDAAEKASERHYVYEGSVVIANKGKVDRTVITNLDRMHWSLNVEKKAIGFGTTHWPSVSGSKSLHSIPCEYDLKPVTLRPREAVHVKFTVETMQALDEAYMGYSISSNYKERFGYWSAKGSVKSDKVKIVIHE
jgi:hypothetical protein